MIQDSSRFHPGFTLASSPFTSLPHGDASGLSPQVRNDLEVARAAQANVLLVGADFMVANLVTDLVQELNPVVTIAPQNGKLQLPTPSRVRAIVVRNVDGLSSEAQSALLRWLDAGRNRTQVVSTAAVPLLPLLDAGAFDAALYYRLNTVYIDLSE